MSSAATSRAAGTAAATEATTAAAAPATAPARPAAHPATQPIGMFDSGIGGLTVARAVAQALPHERIIYFGDTAHLPYGDKSTAAIQAYAVKICDLLLRQQCKLIMIPCNSASAAAYELVREYVGSKARVLNVIDPIVEHIGTHYAGRTVGLIGTKQTVNSNVYKKKIDDLDAGVTLQQLATPLLAPMIEEGFFENAVSDNIIRTYLENPALAGIDALVLACTHYPLIKEQIARFYAGRVEVLDASDAVAQHAKAYLGTHHPAACTARPSTPRWSTSRPRPWAGSPKSTFTKRPPT